MFRKAVVVHMKEGAVPDGAERFAIILTAKAYVMDNRYESALPLMYIVVLSEHLNDMV